MRNDIKVKAILKENGIQLIKYVGNKKYGQRVGENGVEVFQQYGIVVVHTNGIVSVDEMKEMLKDLDCEKAIY